MVRGQRMSEGRRSSSPSGWDFAPSLGRFLARIVPEMYAESIPGRTRMLLSPPYNAAMMAISPAWQRLRRLDPLVPDTVLAVVLVISARAEAGSGYMLPILVTAIPLIWRRRY